MWVNPRQFYFKLVLTSTFFNRVQCKLELDTIRVIFWLILHWPFLTVHAAYRPHAHRHSACTSLAYLTHVSAACMLHSLPDHTHHTHTHPTHARHMKATLTL